MKKLTILFTFLTVPLFAQDSLWVEQTVPFENGMLNGITYVGSDSGWAVGRNEDDGSAEIVRTTNAGEEWTLQESGFSGQLKNIFMIDRNFGFTVGQNWDSGYLTMLKTINGGDNWSDANIPQVHGALNDVQFRNSTNGIAVGESFDAGKIIILYTTDGSSWNEAQVPEIDAYLETVCFSDDLTAFAVGTYWGVDTEVPYVLRTTDGGATWVELSHPVTNGSFMGISFVSPDIGLICGGMDHDVLLLLTTD